MMKQKYQQPSLEELDLSLRLGLLESLSGEVGIEDYNDGGDLTVQDRTDFLGND